MTSRIESVDYAHDIRPYLQLPHLLSLTWLAYPILSLVFVVFRLQLSSGSAQDAVANAKEDLLASCKAAEHAATSTASMPRYLAIATNQQITDAVNGTMNAARATLVLALTIMEAIINFVIDIYRSTLLCFIELIVRSVLSVLITLVDDANSLIQKAATPIADTLENAANVVNTFISAASKFASIIGVSIPSHIDTSGLNSLKNFTLPSSIGNDLRSLNNSIPSPADLKGKIESIVDTPFELLKKDINETFGGLSFDVSALPLPSQNTVTFCDQMDTSVVDDLGRDMVKVVKIGTIIMIFLIILLIAANCALEWYKWRAMKTHFQRIRDGLVSDPDVKTQRAPDGRLMVGMSDHDLMSIEGTMSHPLVTKIVNKLERLLRLSKPKKDKLIWFFHYVFHPPAMACFLIGFFGLLSVELQLLAIGPIQAKFQQQTQASVSNFSNLIATSMNASMYNQSAAYAMQVNSRVDHVQSAINDGVFGWVNGTTTTLNDTISTFYADVQGVINSVFGGTPLNEPLQEFLNCFLGSKVDAIENALTFLHDNLRVDIPRVNDTVLVLSPQSVNEATQPIAEAAVGTGNGDNGGLVARVVAVYVKSLKQERIMFGIFAGLWLFVVLMALCILLWTSYGRPLLMRARSRRNGGGDAPDRIDAFYGGYASEKHAEAGENGHMYDVKLADAQDEKAEPRARFWSSFKGPWGGKHARAQSPDEGAPPPPYPQVMQKPEYQKSWDNILDNADFAAHEADAEANAKISRPFRLMALSRKPSERKGVWRSLFGASKKDEDAPPLPAGELAYTQEREVFADENVKPQQQPEPEPSAYKTRFHEHLGAAPFSKPSLSKHTQLFKSISRSKKQQPQQSSSHDDPFTDPLIPSAERSDSSNPHPQALSDSVFPTDPFVDRLPAGQTFETQALTQLRPSSNGNGRPRSRPNLSISTDNSTFIPDNLPVIVRTPASDDAHMSLGAPPKPWVAQDVKATLPPAPQQPKAAGIPLPLYYGYERPPPGLPPRPTQASVSASSQYLKPPSLLPSPPRQQQTRIDPDTSTPVTRLMATTHARKSSQAVDPFVTPFDDEHRVAPATQTYAVSLPRAARHNVYAANPFADPARTSISIGTRPASNPFATAIAV